MVNTTFPVMDETIRFRAMPEFVHQDCVKLRGNGGAHKHNCVVKPLSLLNTGSITTFLSILLSVQVRSERFEKRSKKQMKLLIFFFDKCLLPDVIS